MLAGAWPDPVTGFSTYLISIGFGLVFARIGGLGPYKGVFGLPWFESRLHDTLVRETARAQRYGRQFTVLAVHEHRLATIDWSGHLRLSDQEIRCRDGWVLLLLPETDQPAALELLRRARSEIASECLAHFPKCLPEHLGRELAKLVASGGRSGNVALSRNGEVSYVPLKANEAVTLI